MTIRKGESWGEPVRRPTDLCVVASDHEVAAAMRTDPNRPIGPTAGDLHRSVGSPPARSAMQRFSIDALTVRADGREYTAVAHVVARRSWWRGRLVAALNVDHIGDWNVAPRAHPNDGRMDVVEVDPAMSVRARWQARNRLPGGTHVPHPQISVRTDREVEWSFDRPYGLWVDGVRVADVRSVSVAIAPDALAIVV